MKMRILSKIRGFTLIELYVVMTIMIIIVSLAGSTSRARNDRLLLSFQIEKMRSLLIRAKYLTTNSIALKDNFCGYGVHIDHLNKQAFIFSDYGACDDLTSNKRYHPQDGDVRQDSTIDFISSSGVVDFACFVPNSDVPLQDFSDASCGVDFVFVPPDPKVVITNNSGIVINNSVFLGSYVKRDPQKFKKIEVNREALVDII